MSQQTLLSKQADRKVVSEEIYNNNYIKSIIIHNYA